MYFIKALRERILPYLIGFNFILLVYKSKFLIILVISTLQILYFFIFNPMVLVDWNIYGISLSGVSTEDIRLLYNVFGTNILLVNIFFLIFMNQNLFLFDFDKKRFFESLKRDHSYWICLALALILTFYFSTSWPSGEIVNIHFLGSPCGLPYRQLLLDQFNFRSCLIFILRLLAIYVAFASHNRSLFYRLLVWLFLIFLLRIGSLNSSFIVDVLVCFIVANPEINNLKDFNWKIYFESVFSLSMENKTETDGQKIQRLEKSAQIMRDALKTNDKNMDIMKEALEKSEKSLQKRRESIDPAITSWSSRWMHFFEPTKDKNERYDHCLDKWGTAYDCAAHTQTLISQAIQAGYPETGKHGAAFEKVLDVGGKLVDKNEKLTECVNNPNWKNLKAQDLHNEQEALKEKVKKAAELAHDEWRWRG